MSKGLLFGVGLLVAGGLFSPSPFFAQSLAADADTGVIHHSGRVAEACPRVWTCSGGLCEWEHVCRPMGCPDGYGCYPLYGAYGPYGGSAYWSSFSNRN